MPMFVYGGFPDASIIRVWSPRGIWHYGILEQGSTLGCQYVIHALKEHGVCRTTFAEFAGGYPPELVRTAPELYRNIVLSRAYSQIGQPYDLFAANCEHFVNWVFDGVPRSDQLRTAGLFVAGIAAFAWLAAESR